MFVEPTAHLPLGVHDHDLYIPQRVVEIEGNNLQLGHESGISSVFLGFGSRMGRVIYLGEMLEVQVSVNLRR